MPAPVSRPASDGPAWPAPMMMASNALHRSAATISDGAADGDGVLDERGRAIAAERAGEPPRQRATAERADDGADDAGNERRRSERAAAPRRWRRRDSAPLTIRAPNCTGTVRLGVVGSWSSTSSPSASTVKIHGAARVAEEGERGASKRERAGASGPAGGGGCHERA